MEREMSTTVYIGGTPKSEAPVLSDARRELLLDMGLTEHDLAFMGARQRQMVEEVLAGTERIQAKNAATA
tara:strand:+ start:21839 stop:22048 length:210 start_codon:yes stop_codon:yes gene_type:complete